MINEVLNNFILLNVFMGWLCAQLLKTVIYFVIHKRFSAERLVGAGGMPSSHSASVTALAAAAGMQYGFDSFAFAISAVLAIIVMHDARGVRKEAGEHAKILNQLNTFLHSHGNQPSPQIILKEFVGHTSFQVFVGALIGIAVALVMHQLV
ncbi:divergent PAP2 family protein [Paenibacillus sp. YN15]|uniref:divergent PAP2 family protein n=1 Tax=Paenibacillus sp. YN15 TaxID=1742774 RepID=UPI000DCB768A|nr:divergent PAP2 family protein [Paenibacillus sp. YN15]RAV01283.1 divergent PAP2 family protein [Paenibacillus sp. YN15]